MPEPPCRVLLVEDHEVLASGLGLVLRLEGYDVRHLGAAGGPEAVLAGALSWRPSVVVLDLHLDGEIGDGCCLVGPLRHGGAAVVVLTGETDPAQLGACLEAGAVGVAHKSRPMEEIIGLIAAAAAGRPVIDPRRRAELVDAARAGRADKERLLGPFARLSKREREVLAGLVHGRSAEQVAVASYVSIATVRSHIRSVLQKVGAGSQLQAVAKAREAGWDG